MCCTRPIPVEVHGSLGAQPSVFYSSTDVTNKIVTISVAFQNASIVLSAVMLCVLYLYDPNARTLTVCCYSLNRENFNFYIPLQPCVMICCL